MCRKRNRTSSEDVGHGLYLYFLGLSFRNVAKASSFLHIVRIGHVAVWSWLQKYKPQKMSSKGKVVPQFIIDETQIRVGYELLWLWVASEPKTHAILRTKVSEEGNMIVAKRFPLDTVEEYGKHPYQQMEVHGIRKHVYS